VDSGRSQPPGATIISLLGRDLTKKTNRSKKATNRLSGEFSEEKGMALIISAVVSKTKAFLFMDEIGFEELLITDVRKWIESRR